MRDRENGFGMKKEEKAWKVERDKVDHDQAENKKANKNKQQQPQDLRGFFQGGAMESEKKGVRQARERLEQVEAKEQGMTTLTQLKGKAKSSYASVYLDLALVDFNGVGGEKCALLGKSRKKN